MTENVYSLGLGLLLIMCTVICPIDQWRLWAWDHDELGVYRDRTLFPPKIGRNTPTPLHN